ncbi:AMP-binding protein [Henriciella sp. AS95]|uniref:AMP-binding protein n=1 Tax=Henriciella sp. AS95 TaxID=3135782 RepID=UPI0031780DAF
MRPSTIDPACNPFAGWDIRTLLNRQAARFGDKPCLIWEPLDGQEEIWTYGEFVSRLKEVGAGLYARGIRAGDRVIVHLDNCPEQMFAWLGCAWIGAVAVTTNSKSSKAELSYFAEKSKARAAITQPKFADLIADAFGGAEWIVVTTTDTGEPPAEMAGSYEPFESLSGASATLPDRDADCTAPFGVQFTSGTTSRPKGVVWTHANALWGGRVSALHEGLGPEDVHLVYLPMFHTNAQIYSVMASLWVGAGIVLQPRFSASRFWPVALKHKCTWTSMVPFMVQALLEYPVPDNHSFRFWGNAVCDLPSDAHFGVRSIGWWGMTETITHGIVGSVHHADRPKSMGRVAPEYEIAIVSADGRPAGLGETGDLLIRGQRGLSLFLEYLDDPVATEAAFNEDGWFVTGDRVKISEDGWLIFADRSKDMLKVGGENVAASEVESVISAFPDVQEVAVVAKPHKMLDEVPVAFVRLSDPVSHAPEGIVDALARHCRGELASFKVPVEFHVVDELPRSTLNKIAKAELRKMLVTDGH